MTDTKHWITKLVPMLAFAAGIIIASVGGIMTISSSLKLAFFESEPYSYVSEEQCRYEYRDSTAKPIMNDAENAKAQQEINDCLKERRQEEKIRFQNNQKENIVDGVSALFVGGILLFAFRRRK